MSAVYIPALKYSGNYSDMDSRNIHIQQQQQQQISGLLRYRSAPSSVLGKMVEREGGWRGLDHQQHEKRRYVPCFDAEVDGMLDSGSNNGWSNVKQGGGGGGGGGGSVFWNEADQLIYNSHEGFQEPAVSGPGSSVMMVNSFQNSTQSKMASGNCSNNLLLKQKSSPPGFFSNFSLTNALGEPATTSTSGLNGGAFTFSSEPSSSYPRRMPQIAENGNETLENKKEQEEAARTCVETRRLRNDNGSHHKSYMPSFTSDFWESSSFTAHTTASSDSEFLFSTSSDALESQQADQFRYQNVGLTHQMSLPSSSTKTGGIERILHIQGSVPCKIRAKRGFATHPRSIAERERRTRISERIKKLQELFPKSDKQTNTADMLDLAVDYIKDLQKQVKILTNTRAKCRCTSVQKQ